MIQSPHPAHEYHLRGTTAQVSQTPEFAGGPLPCVVTDMVKLRKLNTELISFYPYPSAGPVLQAKGLFETTPVWGPFFATKLSRILQFSAKICKKPTEKTRFSRPILLNRVKSRGPCQSVIGAPYFQRSLEIIAKELPTQRHRGKRRMAGVGKTKGVFMPPSLSPLSLCASAVNSSRQSIVDQVAAENALGARQE